MCPPGQRRGTHHNPRREKTEMKKQRIGKDTVWERGKTSDDWRRGNRQTRYVQAPQGNRPRRIIQFTDETALQDKGRKKPNHLKRLYSKGDTASQSGHRERIVLDRPRWDRARTIDAEKKAGVENGGGR